MPKRLPRRHHTGKSNLERAIPAIDVEELKVRPPILRYIDPHEHVAKDWKRPTKLYEPPTVTQTKLGGTLVRPESRCSAQKVAHVVDSFMESHKEVVFMQKQWSNAQPLLGVSEWLPGEAPRAKPIFTNTDDIFQ